MTTEESATMGPHPGSTQALGSAPATPPQRIGDYRIEATVGEGGMGRVYACRDEALDRRVAIKVLLPEVAREPAMTERFLREARAMATLTSPRVVTVYHVGQDSELPYLVMEFLEGEDLSRTVKRQGALPVDEVLRHARHVVEGLQAATRAGLVHRDIKPSNLFLTPGGVKLTDFGLARPLDGSADLTQAGLVVGSPHYLAPELARGQAATAQSDMYALGASLCELLTGQPPYLGQTPVDVVTQHLTQPVPDLLARRPGLPAALNLVVQRLMAKRPEDRFPDYAGVEAALRSAAETAAAGEGPTLPPSGPGALTAANVQQRSAGAAPVAGSPATAAHGSARAGRWPVALVVLAAVGALAWWLLGDDPLDRIDGGQARAVLAELDRVAADRRTGEDELLRGHALHKLGRRDEAMAAYARAAGRGAIDGRAHRHLLGAIAAADAPAAVAALVAWPDDDLDDALRALVRDGEWWSRHNAIRALKERGAADPELEEQLGLRDLKEGDSCPRRRMGLMRLKRVARSDAALQAIRSASQRVPDNLCMLLDFATAEQEVRRRLPDAAE